MTASSQPESPGGAPAAEQSGGGLLDSKCIWCLPCGCIGAVVLVGGGGLAIALLVFSFLKSTAPFQQSLQAIQNDPRVVEYLGTQIEDGWWVSGNVNINNTSGVAVLQYPVSGHKTHGIASVEASMVDNVWTLDHVSVVVQGRHDPIVLVDEGQPVPDESPGAEP